MSSCYETRLTNQVVGTFVRPSLSQFPRSPRAFWSFLRDYIVTSVRCRLQTIIIPFSSKPSLFKAARYKLNNSLLLLTAKAMHRSLAQALAEGDKDTLRKICTKRLSLPMLASIDRRPRSRRYTWELVRYNGSWRNPRIVSQIIQPIAPGSDAPMIRQAVVAISSRQRRVEYEMKKVGQWEIVPGSEKEVDLTENLVLVSLVDQKTWRQDEWYIVGTIQPTTPEEWADEKASIQALEQEQLQKFRL